MRHEPQKAPPFVRAQACPNERKPLLQLRVLRLGFSQDGDVRVGIFPEGEQVLVGGPTLCGVALKGIGTSHSEMGQSRDRGVSRYAPVVEDFLELLRRLSRLRSQISLAASVDG